MRNIFIVNPAAGQGKGDKRFIDNILKAAEKSHISAEIYITKEQGDGEAYVRKTSMEAEPGQSLRFFACGGDGTLNEVVNGAYSFQNVEVGCVPIGTGNDFIRNFGEASSFSDIELQLKGKSRPVDLIHYENEFHGEIKKGYVINMFNIGFDANVVDMTARMKEKPLISGSLAYLLSIGLILIKKKGADLLVKSGEETLHNGSLLLCSAANGAFCGGGIKGMPLAYADDGLADICIVKNVSRVTFIKLFPKYMKGTYLELAEGKKIVNYYQKSQFEIKANNGYMRVCFDGELMDSERIAIKNLPKVIRFIVPDNKI